MRRRRGALHAFTLIELLVVIAVITILAAIVLPVYNGAQDRARQGQCLANLSGIAVAMKLYRNEYKRYPLGALKGNVTDLPDFDDNEAYTAAAYNTSDVDGRKTRINALYPSYLEDQKSLICPNEDEDTALVTGTDGDNALNGQDTELVLVVGGDGSASSYDDFYNVFGYANSSTGTVSLGQGTPITTATTSGGRKALRLSNPYAPGQTIITYCREHEENYDPNAAISLIVRVDGKAEKVVRQQFSWSTQVETAYN